MNFTFWVTEDCNLNCSYCYVNKNPKSMTIETAEKALDFVVERIGSSRNLDEKIYFQFHGGEPLLNYEVINFLTLSLKEKFGDNARFKLTTNGTIFNKEMFEFLLENISISISIDGMKYYNNLNRKYKNGKGTFDTIISTLEHLKDKQALLRIRMTVNISNVQYFADNYIYLHNLGYKLIAFEADEGDELWSYDHIKTYGDNIRKILDYLIKKDYTYAQYLLYTFKLEYFRGRSICDGCDTTFNISYDGGVYPCIVSLGDASFKLGDINTGMYKDKLVEFKKINMKENESCYGCAFYNNCRTKMCKVINKVQTGDFYKASPVFCNIQKSIYEIIKDYEYILENFQVE